MKKTPIKRRGKHRPVKHQDEAKRAWIRLFSCYASRLHKCVGITQCAHEKHGVKKDDKRMGPACAQLHTELHQLTAREIKAKYGWTWAEVCANYDEAWEAQQEWVG